MQIYTDANGVSVNALGADHPDHPEYAHYYELSDGERVQKLEFQMGPVPTNGCNGTTLEAVLAVSLHRLNVLNHRFPCEENKIALDAMERALSALEYRTAQRIARGVEGKNVV